MLEVIRSVRGKYDWWAYASIAGAILVLLAPWLLNVNVGIVSPTELGSDFVTKQLPNAKYITETWNQWREVPLWHATVLGGHPIVGNPSMLLPYPPYWLIFIGRVGWALSLFYALHLIWAGFGTYHLARVVFRASAAAGIFSALTFCLSAKMLAHVGGGHADIIAAVAWLPWLWSAVDRLVRSPGWRPMAGTALSMTSQALTHLPTLWLSTLVVGGWATLVLLERWRSQTRTAWVGLSLAVLGALALAAGLGAVHLWPMVNLLPLSTRGGMTLSEASQYALPPYLLIGLFANTALAFPEWTMYPGSVVWILAPAGHRSEKSNAHWWFLVGTASLGVLFSLGSATPFFRLAFQVLPGMRWFRVPPRALFATQLALALLTGLGWEATSKLGRRPGRPLIGWWFAFIAIACVAAAWTHLLPGVLNSPMISPVIAFVTSSLLIRRSILGTRSPLAVALLVAAISLEAATLAPQFLAKRSVRDMLTPGDEISFVKSQPGLFRTFSPSGIISRLEAVAHGLETADGIDPFQMTHYATWMNAASGCGTDGYSVSVPACSVDQTSAHNAEGIRPVQNLLAIGNVRYVVADRALTAWGDAVWRSGETRVFNNPESLPRAFLVPGVVNEPDDAAALALLRERGPRGCATVSEADARVPLGSVEYRAGEARLVGPNGLEVQVAGPGWLVVGVTWAPGWRVRVDGEPAKLYRTDVTFCGLPLQSGNHVVTLRYFPTGWQWGRLISGVSLLVAVVVTVVTYREKHQRHACR